MNKPCKNWYFTINILWNWYVCVLSTQTNPWPSPVEKHGHFDNPPPPSFVYVVCTQSHRIFNSFLFWILVPKGYRRISIQKPSKKSTKLRWHRWHLQELELKIPKIPPKHIIALRNICFIQKLQTVDALWCKEP